VTIVPRGVTYPAGFRATGMAAGIKRSGRPDISLVVSDRPCAAAGVFTTNLVRAAPVLIGEAMLREHPTEIRGILTISGVANAMTGPEGIRDNEIALEGTADEMGLPQGRLLPACTGVIGPRIPVPRFLKALPELRHSLRTGAEAEKRAAHAMLTTDTRSKQAAVRTRLRDGTYIHVAGMAKGSGMIAPRMGRPHATALAFLTTDARARPAALSKILLRETDRTFNMVSIDGDTSTNDTVYILANGAAGGPIADEDPAFHLAVHEVMESLAKQVARDGEGATKLLSVTVTGARNVGDARSAAKAVVGSMLVKAAMFGSDPNVGRIAAALGRSGAPFDPERMDVVLRLPRQEVALITNGRAASGLENGHGKKIRDLLLRLDEVPLEIRLHEGRARATAWGCDLSYSYVQINAAYHT
jgi:glutamate N-acetyltransferase/amino-acid N-acetyltransferase